MLRTPFKALIMLCFMSMPVLAQHPKLYDVTGVAADDVLNVRAAPSASAPILGTLAPDARGIEVTAVNDTASWGRINTGESAGWVSMRFLQARGVQIDHFNLPVGLTCYGTEPFWSLSNIGGAMRFDALGGREQDMAIWIAQDSGIENDLRRMVHMAGIGGPATAFLYPAECSDGMSDRLFGLSISLMTAPDAALLSGCCQLQR